MKRVAVVPPSAYAGRRRLLAALEPVFPVRFEPREAGEWKDVDGVVAFSDEDGRIESDAAAAGLAVLSAAEEGTRRSAPAPVALADDEALDRRLRGTIHDLHAGALPSLRVAPGFAVLASSRGKALWTASEAGPARRDRVVRLPDEAESQAPLASQLTAGRFLSLLPLVHFLLLLVGDGGWQGPPMRAAFIVDDPNLHATSYGYIDYRALARHALDHQYHIAMAMVPLDALLARRSAVEVFGRHPDRLSLVVHGNDHVRGELDRPTSDEEARRLMAQALRRVTAFERRSGLAVGRVMVPPHERASAAAFRAMRQLSFEAALMDWQCPWINDPVVPRTDAELQLAGWYPSELLGGGLPTLARSYWTNPAPDLALRAFRNHALIFYGHHENAADPDALAQTADRVNGLGSVTWSPLPDIVRSSFSTRREGTVLRVRMFSTAVSVDIPSGVESVRVETPMIHDRVEGTLVSSGAQTSPLEPAGATLESGALPVRADERVDLSLRIPGSLDPLGLPPPKWRPWPLVRRGVTEGRDRLRPLMQREEGAR